MGTKVQEVKAAPAEKGVRRFRVPVSRQITVSLNAVIEVEVPDDDALSFDRNGTITRAVNAKLAEEKTLSTERNWSTASLENFSGTGKILIRWGRLEEIAPHITNTGPK